MVQGYYLLSLAIKLFGFLLRIEKLYYIAFVIRILLVIGVKPINTNARL